MRRHLLLTLLSALLLSLPWYESFSGLLLLVAFVPLLMVEHDFAKSNRRGFWKYAWLCLLLWNAATTWWICNATFFGMVGAFIGNSVQMLLVVWLFHVIKKRAGSAVGYAAFVALWLAWEWFYFDAEITWPWLTLGNGLAKDVKLVQWYELTGALGGSLWILLSNLLVFFILQKQQADLLNFRAAKVEKMLLAALVAAPCCCSLVRFYTYREAENPCRVAILQPNIDPFNDKFGGMSAEEQQRVIFAQAASVATDSADYVIAPETALENMLWENSIEQNSLMLRLKSFCAQRPNVSFVTGATTYYLYGEDEDAPPTSRLMKNSSRRYDVYNAALQADSSGRVLRYHKSKLVVGVEMLPYPKYLNKIIGRFAISLGGTSGGLGTQKERVAFTSSNRKFKAGVAICYESIFGQFYTEYIKKGANVMMIITNDGWWRDTPGHRQHLRYASLRAIETRRSIARSANTGISAIVNQRGEIVQRTSWWTRDTLSGTINANEHITPYVKHGDIVGRAAGIATLLILLYTLVVRCCKPKPKTQNPKPKTQNPKLTLTRFKTLLGL
ncbi:MAG: apolipoprotein N-acyltransferase [Prevotellaceae bacterium]|jgi:apolipoprotein N-acyltransferase|nr:apolipoprotein N-acyltransferase [Prevotellaceae bacterium]